MAPVPSCNREREIGRHQRGHHALTHVVPPHRHARIRLTSGVARFRRADERILMVREPTKHSSRNGNTEPNAKCERASDAAKESNSGLATPRPRLPVEDHERNSRHPEDQHVHEQVLLEPQRPARDRGGKEQQRQRPRERMRDMPAQVNHRLRLHQKRIGAAQQCWQDLARSLDAALSPASLLHLQRLDRRRDFRRCRDVVEVREAPTSHLRSVAQIEILSERISVPPACFLETLSPPHARGTVEIEEAIAGMTTTLLEEEVPIQKKRLRLREPCLVAIQVVPPSLHHANGRVLEWRQKITQQARG